MLRSLFIENIGWKLLSLGLATLLWYGLLGETEMASAISTPVLYKNLPRDLEISNDLPERIYVKVRGSSARMTLGSLQQVAVVLDLKSVTRPGERTFALDEEALDLPFGVELIRVVPSQLRLKFEKSITTEVSVQARLSPPPAGYRIASQQVTPDRVRIAGPESLVRAVTAAVTDPIDLSNTVASGEFRTAASVDDPHVRMVGNPIVRVRVDIEKVDQP
jgi:YbbR domain-containing protein